MARREDLVLKGGGQLRMLALLADVGEQRSPEGPAERFGHPLVEQQEISTQVAGRGNGAGRGKSVHESGDDEIELGLPAPVDGRLAGPCPVRDALDAEAVEAVLGQLIEGRAVDGLFQCPAAAARAPPEVVTAGTRLGLWGARTVPFPMTCGDDQRQP